MIRSYLPLLFALAAVSSCGARTSTSKSDTSAPADESGGERLAENIRQLKSGNEKVTEYDLNRDKKPDVFVYTVAAKTEDGKEFDRVVRKEIDVNWDGKIDLVRNYDENEQVVTEKLDLDFDGKVDQVNYYERGALVRKERDLGHAGKPNTWIFFEKGKIVRKERDTDGDGKVDYWEYWENDQVDRIGEDRDGDGTVDAWITNPDNKGDGT